MSSDPAVATAETRRRAASAVPQHGLLRAIITWAIIAAFLAAAAISSVGAVNQNVYGAGNFVREYLAALAAHDAGAALSLPGVDVTGASSGARRQPTVSQSPTASAPPTASALPTGASRVLLRNSMTSDIRNIEVVGEAETPSGTTAVTVDYVLDEQQQRSTFELEQTAPRYGIFRSWRFASSPLAAVSLTVLHESVFHVSVYDVSVHNADDSSDGAADDSVSGANVSNTKAARAKGLQLDIRSSEPDQPDPFVSRADYLVFTPGAYTFSHTSRLLKAKPVTATVTEPLAMTDVEVNTQANAEFIKSVQTELNSYLDDCASQEVLLPSGCPFGQFIENRLRGLPTWSIAKYPKVTLTATETAWDMPETKGTARLRGEVLSLFDGSISDLDEKVPFSVALTASIRSDGSLDIRVR